MTSSLPPRSGAVPPRATPSPRPRLRWWPGVLGAVLLVGSGGLARMNPRGATGEPPTASAAPSASPVGEPRAQGMEPACGTGSIREVLEDARAPADARASAASALGRCLGLEAIPTLITRLEDREVRVREAVAVALGRLGGQQARQALEDRLPMEEQPLVREALQRGLTLVEP